MKLGQRNYFPWNARNQFLVATAIDPATGPTAAHPKPAAQAALGASALWSQQQSQPIATGDKPAAVLVRLSTFIAPPHMQLLILPTFLQFASYKARVIMFAKRGLSPDERCKELLAAAEAAAQV